MNSEKCHADVMGAEIQHTSGSRASPAHCADEDVHNPSVDGLLYVSVTWLLQRSETVVSTRGIRNRPDKRCSGGIGADVSRRRKQKTLGFVVSRIEEVFAYKMLRLGLGTYQERGCFNGRIPSLLRVGCAGESCYHRFILRMQPDRTPAGGVAVSAAPAVEGSMPEDG